MTASQRILINTLAAYGRTVFSMVLGLFSSRWVLEALGAVDYGLMGVVGVLIVFVMFFNCVTACSCDRFFAYSLGSGGAILGLYEDEAQYQRLVKTMASIGCSTIKPSVIKTLSIYLF